MFATGAARVTSNCRGQAVSRAGPVVAVGLSVAWRPQPREEGVHCRELLHRRLVGLHGRVEVVDNFTGASEEPLERLLAMAQSGPALIESVVEFVEISVARR